MSATFVTVQWSAKKLIYDAVLLASVGAFIAGYQLVTYAAIPGDQQPHPAIISMRAFGTCAFLLLTFILMLGPLARLDRRFLPLLYNRRHAGVLFAGLATWHAKQVLDLYHAFLPISKIASLWTYDAGFAGAAVPFQLLGAGALVICLVMAVTSHDFWQRFLGPRVWKGLHMLVYLAYGLTIAHVAFGALQLERHPLWLGWVVASVALVGGLHLAAAFKAAREDRDLATTSADIDGLWLDAGPAERFKLDRPIGIMGPDGERIAVVRHADGISAVHGVCAHQGGPLAEGRVIDGCLTCPWHGWQYRPADGRSPPPFEERLPTYRVRLDQHGHVQVALKPDAAGTPQIPAEPCA